MELLEVKSSNIKRIGFENKKLFVEFTSGALYEYEDVEQEVFTKLMESNSKGKFLRETVLGKYKYKKI